MFFNAVNLFVRFQRVKAYTSFKLFTANYVMTQVKNKKEARLASGRGFLEFESFQFPVSTHRYQHWQTQEIVS